MSEDKELEKIKNQVQLCDVLTQLSELVSGVPGIGEPIGKVLGIFVKKHQDYKIEKLLDYIKDKNNFVTIEMVHDIDVIMNFAKILEAVNRLSQNDKIKYFANLFKNGFFKEEKIIQDEFDEYFYIINTLSNRELIILYKIYDYTINYPRKEENKVDHENWNIMKSSILDELKICGEQFDSYVEKLSSMGIIKINITWGYLKGTSPTAYVSPHFYKFVDIVIKK